MEKQKKSNKLTFVYVASSIALFLVLLGGGIYGIYLSVGINFMRSSVAQPADVEAGVSNVSFSANANFQPSMTGVIILSAVLVLLSIFYFISLIKQIIFFKQFKLIREAKFEKFIEGKVKSKSSVVFFACLINVLSFLAGIAGIFVNIRSFMDGGLSWLLYVVDGLVIILSVVSFVLLIKKVRQQSKLREEIEKNYSKERKNKASCSEVDFFDEDAAKDVDRLEYILLKLKNMKNSKVISDSEHDYLRKKLTGLKQDKKTKTGNKSSEKIVK